MAPAHNTCVTSSRCFDRNWRGVRSRTLYLYPVLMKHYEDKTTQLVIVVGFMILHYLFDIQVFAHIALALGLIFLLSKKLTNGVLWLWWKIAQVLGWINTRILLTLVFYLLLLPISMLFKLFSKDPLNINWKKTASSFEIRDHTYVADDLENPW